MITDKDVEKLSKVFFTKEDGEKLRSEFFTKEDGKKLGNKMMQDFNKNHEEHNTIIAHFDTEFQNLRKKVGKLEGASAVTHVVKK